MEQPIRAVFTGRNTVNRLQRNSKSDFSTPDALGKIPIRVVPSNDIQITPQQVRVLENENLQEDLDIALLKRQEQQDLEDTDDLRVNADQASEYLSINRADISSLREDLREQYEEQREAANTESLESVLLINAREQQIKERETLDVIHEKQRDQCVFAQAAATRLRGKQQHQARRMGKLRWQHASMYTQLQQLQQNQDLIAKREDVAQEELCEDRADIIVMKAQLDVHLDHIIEHDLQMKQFSAEQEAEEVRTSSGIGKLNAAFALVTAAVDDIENDQERQLDDLRDAEIALDRVTQVTELTHACVDNLLDVSAGIWNGHDMITTLARQQDVVETQQRVGNISDLRGEHQRETNALRQLIKQQASTADRLDDVRKHVWSLTDQVQNAFDILEEQEDILNSESERAQHRELSIAKSSGFALKMLRESVLELNTMLRQNGRELVDLQRLAVNFQREARKMEAAARKDTEVIEQEIRRADDIIMELGNKIEWFKMVSKKHRRQVKQEGRELMGTEQEETNEYEGSFTDEFAGPVARQILAVAEVAPDGTEISYRYLEGDECDGMFVAF